MGKNAATFRVRQTAYGRADKSMNGSLCSSLFIPADFRSLSSFVEAGGGEAPVQGSWTDVADLTTHRRLEIRGLCFAACAPTSARNLAGGAHVDHRCWTTARTSQLLPVWLPGAAARGHAPR